MIHIYGDSHARFSFNNLEKPNNNLNVPSITMFRIGRDNIIINFNKYTIKPNDIIVLSYGEVDCRCHIKRQINLGKDEDDVIHELVNNYIRTIRNNTIDLDVKIIIVGVIPPTKQDDFEKLNGPILHEFPFVGTDEDRVRYTNKINKLLEEMSNNNNYMYFNPYSYYTRDDGTLKYELSDNNVHLRDNSYLLEKFMELVKCYSRKI
jgi:hypothetical protein